jgi:hypothetical protein
MKKILTLVGVSVLGGLLTLGGYKLFIEEQQPEQLAVEQVSDLPIYVPTNTTINDSAAITPNFVEAAEKSLDAVVHVKNTAIVSAPVTMSDYFFGQITTSCTSWYR